jgi:hypothetical protein
MTLLGIAGLALALTPHPVARNRDGAVARLLVHVSGKPGARVRLESAGLPQGWLATFCTSRVCAPRRVSVELPRSGSLNIEVHLIQVGAR